MNSTSKSPQTLLADAQGALQKGAFATAQAHLLCIINQHPQFADAHHLLGISYYQQGMVTKATQYIANAVKIAPKNLHYLNNYALMLNALNQPIEAIKYLQQAIILAPKDLDIQLNVANTLLALNKFEEAAGYYRRLLRIQSQRDDIRTALCHCLTKIGNTAHQQGHFKLAEAAFSEAISFNNKDAIYYYNLANAQRELALPKAALENYQKALRLSPNDADIHNNLGNVQRELGYLDEAIKSYETALTLNPHLHHALVHLVHQKQHVCDWTNLNQHIQIIRSWVKDIPVAQISPFAFLAMPSTTAIEQQQCASNWVTQRYCAYLNAPLRIVNQSVTQNTANKKLKIGYLSADFRLHPLAFLITDLIRHHDKAKFDVIGLSYGINDKSAERKALEKAFTEFYDIQGLSEIECAKKIQALDIDILVDLTGFTQSSRSGIAALKPAPISVNWLGFPGTMGHYTSSDKAAQALFDYLITDEVIIPDNHKAFYSERLLHLPCYQANNHQRPVATAPSRAEYYLPDHAFVFCAFNQTFKITQDVFNVWMQLLNTVPNSVLWLLDCNVWAKQNLIAEARALGVAAERLIFASRVTIDKHLARHCHADVFLDTLPYNAHTTCSDALWMGLPVITCMGDTFASRVAASLIQSSGLTVEETCMLIAKDLTQYYEHAVYLSQNIEILDAIKTRLLAARETSSLFNPAHFANALEGHYQAIWLNYLHTHVQDSE
jgi:protein O-GlcNAc transferase